MPEDALTRIRLFLVLTATTVSGALALTAIWARDVPKVATGFVANVLCSKTFVSGLDPAEVFSETTAAVSGAGLISWAFDYQVDRMRRDVTMSLLGLGRSHAVYRAGFGCYLDHGDATVALTQPPADSEPSQAALPDIAVSALVAPATPQLEAALDRAFAEPDAPPFRHTKAVLVLKDGHLIAERYAKGYGVDTPILGFSATKSVISALTGIAVRKGMLALDRPAPVAAWQAADDPRHAITVDQLLRQTAGLALGSSLQASLGATLEPGIRMKYMESDMAGYAESIGLATPPGSAWNYNDGNYIILARLIRDAAGGHASDLLRFARQELFGPLGMHNVTLEFDASGNAEGSSQMLATARDWARFGMLYLDDGIVGGKRILPEGWVKYSAAPTPGSWVGYGAGFWTNQGDSRGARYRIANGWPRDAFFAKGTIGQYVIVIPSERLVIVRFGVSPNSPDVDGVSQLIRDVIAATGSATRSASQP
jgi:CubicO group peptidase (beta-lactamase class C family)